MSPSLPVDLVTMPVETVAEITAALKVGQDESYDVSHTFTRGIDGKVNLYTRGCLLLPKKIYVSKKHRTEHPFFILKGSGWVWSDQDRGWSFFKAPFVGITQPGAQRIIWCEEPTVWMTSHATDSDDLAAIEEKIIEPMAEPSTLKANPRQIGELFQ